MGRVGDVPHFHAGGVGFFVRQMAAVGRPPVAGETAHFFLGDEFGEAVGLLFCPAGRDGGFFLSRQVQNVEVVVEDVGDALAVGRELGVDEGAGTGLEGLRRSVVAVEQVEFARQA